MENDSRDNQIAEDIRLGEIVLDTIAEAYLRERQAHIYSALASEDIGRVDAHRAALLSLRDPASTPEQQAAAIRMYKASLDISYPLDSSLLKDSKDAIASLGQTSSFRQKKIYEKTKQELDALAAQIEHGAITRTQAIESLSNNLRPSKLSQEPAKFGIHYATQVKEPTDDPFGPTETLDNVIGKYTNTSLSRIRTLEHAAIESDAPDRLAALTGESQAIRDQIKVQSADLQQRVSDNFDVMEGMIKPDIATLDANNSATINATPPPGLFMDAPPATPSPQKAPGR